MTLKGLKIPLNWALREEMVLRSFRPLLIICGMAKKQPKANDNRKFKVRSQLLGPLDELAERKATDVTELVNQAVRELLEREGLWPPKPEEKE